jgi:trafficking protein particle complex subunit 3
MSSISTTAQSNTLWHKQPKANAELFALTYGALVAELVRDLEQTDKIQAELDRMGHSIGIRCIEEVLAKATDLHVQSFADTKNAVKVAFRMFFGLVVEIATPTAVTTEGGVGGGEAPAAYTIRFTDNPLTIFVELPEDRQDLEYSQIFAGMLRGMLEMLQFDCECQVLSSPLSPGNNSNVTEISVTLKQVLQEGAGEEYQEE